MKIKLISCQIAACFQSLYPVPFLTFNDHYKISNYQDRKIPLESIYNSSKHVNDISQTEAIEIDDNQSLTDC